MEQMHHEKNRGEGFCKNLAYLGGEVCKLFVHFAGHQVSDFKAKMHQIPDFGWGSAPDPAGGANSAPPGPLAGFKGAYF